MRRKEKRPTIKEVPTGIFRGGIYIGTFNRWSGVTREHLWPTYHPVMIRDLGWVQNYLTENSRRSSIGNVKVVYYLVLSKDVAKEHMHWRSSREEAGRGSGLEVGS